MNLRTQMRATHAAATALIAGAGAAGLLDPAGLTDRDSPALPIAIAFVLIFLILLIVRYVLLLWLGFRIGLRRTNDEPKLLWADGGRPGGFGNARLRDKLRRLGLCGHTFSKKNSLLRVGHK